eukprot:3467456-Rhodomonas_salina.2
MTCLSTGYHIQRSPLVLDLAKHVARTALAYPPHGGIQPKKRSICQLFVPKPRVRVSAVNLWVPGAGTACWPPLSAPHAGLHT